ncbi:Uma2 family endonuclease [Solihabitans fulvus]|uniref:Uma2 family endonuclease n=1 Tax=Solihabitans fulvus TaxID=1892852 RepID=A0A5B2XMH6_9PSEU|nr:Uma2 family endonuclease [Solihabitans fulvus]KAA2264937.1 Uma2 family endonuclease [Solihabitans fulvus]
MRTAIGAHTGPWTIEDVEALEDHGNHTRYEILFPGILTVSPAPGTVVHQRASRNLANLLQTAATSVGASVEVLAAVNVEIPGGLLTTPDIVVVDGEYSDSNPPRCQPEMVLAVVEIVALNSRSQDRVIKPRLYASAGIASYWRLELEKTLRLIVSELRRGQYVHTLTAPAGERAEIERPFPVVVDPADLVRQRRP